MTKAKFPKEVYLTKEIPENGGEPWYEAHEYESEAAEINRVIVVGIYKFVEVKKLRVEVISE